VTSARGFRLLSALIASTLFGCAPAPIRTTLPSTWQPSPNFGERRPTVVVVHHTGSNSVDAALQTLLDPARRVSAHYLIGRDGRLLQLVDERHRAWHAGDSRWGSITDVNSTSIGIELVNNGDEPFPAEQIAALISLLKDVTVRHQIPPQNVVGHADVAPSRKSDPNAYFPWRLLATNGFGVWCDEPLPPPPPGFDPLAGLRAIGYDISRPDDALRAFRLHYATAADTPDALAREVAMIACLQRKAANYLPLAD
jgi:N-acetylmuramoyl-L-alanine amidase